MEHDLPDQPSPPIDLSGADAREDDEQPLIAGRQPSAGMGKVTPAAGFKHLSKLYGKTLSGLLCFVRCCAARTMA
jgi:hypothetical protein